MNLDGASIKGFIKFAPSGSATLLLGELSAVLPGLYRWEMYSGFPAYDGSIPSTTSEVCRTVGCPSATPESGLRSRRATFACRSERYLELE